MTAGPSTAHCRVVGASGASDLQLTRAALERELTSGFFWLDVRGPSAEDVAVIGETFGLHPLAVEDSLKFGQRPKLDDYGDTVLIVLYGNAPDQDDLVEVHAYVSERFVVTLRRDASPGIDELYRRYHERDRSPRSAAELVYRLADALVDSFFPALDAFSDRLELIEDDLLRNPRQEHLRDIFAMRNRTARLRRVLAPQRDLVGRIASRAVELPAETAETERYFRDVHDHLIRLGEQLDLLRDGMTAAIDVYLSSSSNQLNEVTKRLTVIATIFLPLAFVTGFFGQNFPWMVDHVGGLSAFLVLGVGSQLAVLLILLLWFRRRGWF